MDKRMECVPYFCMYMECTLLHAIDYVNVEISLLAVLCSSSLALIVTFLKTNFLKKHFFRKYKNTFTQRL